MSRWQVRSWVVFALVALGLVGSREVGRAAPVKKGGVPATAETSKKLREDAVISEKTVTICDVMQDYYYNVETGEFLGWAGPPYTTNCHSYEVPEDQCPIDNPQCHCGGPTCGGGGGQTCSSDATGLVYGGIAKKAPPKCTCQACKDKLQADIDRNTAALRSCIDNWADKLASSRCENGLTRLGQVPSHHIERLFCLSQEYDGYTKFYCTETPEWQKCYRQWMWGLNPTTINDEQWGVSGTLGHGDSNTTVNYLGETFSVSFGQDQTVGAQEMCNTWSYEEAAKVKSRFDNCSKNAGDSKQGICP